MLQMIQHPSHLSHSLSYVQHGRRYHCDGCGMPGHESGYWCETCKFDLHRSCATARPVLYHRFHSGDGHCLQFHTIPPRGGQMCCPACAEPVSGFGYHCTSTSCAYALHPCCANLSETLPDPANRSQILHLAWCLSFPCHVCGQLGPGWAYVTASGNYNFHVACAGSISRDNNYIEMGTEPQQTALEFDGTRDRRIPSLPTSSSSALPTQQNGGGGQIPSLDTPSSSSIAPPTKETKSVVSKLGTFWSISNVLCEMTTAVDTGDPTSIIGVVANLFTNSNSNSNSNS